MWIRRLLESGRTLAEQIPDSLIALVARFAVASVFWRSGQTKLAEGSWFAISDSAYALFETEYSGVPLPPHLAAVLAATAEHVFPIMLVLGFLTRFAALGLLGMTLVIQIFVYPDAWWTEHSLWVAMQLALIVRGAGLISLDHLLTRKQAA